MKRTLTFFTIMSFGFLFAQSDSRIYDIINEVSAQRIEADITTLANFGTRHTLSDTVSQTRGIGAARRWIKAEFDQISQDCNNCLEVFYQSNFIPKGDNNRIVKDVNIVNVAATALFYLTGVRSIWSGWFSKEHSSHIYILKKPE